MERDHFKIQTPHLRHFIVGGADGRNLSCMKVVGSMKEMGGWAGEALLPLTQGLLG